MNGPDLFFTAAETHGSDMAGGGDVLMGRFYSQGISCMRAGPLKLVAVGKRTIIDGKGNVLFQRIPDQLQRGKLCFQNRDPGAVKKRVDPLDEPGFVKRRTPELVEVEMVDACDVELSYHPPGCFQVFRDGRDLHGYAGDDPQGFFQGIKTVMGRADIKTYFVKTVIPQRLELILRHQEAVGVHPDT